MKIYIGCDVGTSSTKAVAVDEKGTILAEGSKRYGLFQKYNNWAEQSPDTWLDGAISSIRDVIAQVGEENISTICISALYGGTGAMLDQNMNPVRPALIWMDRRAEAEREWIQKQIGEKKIFDITNNGTDSYFGYTKLLWVKNHEPENWQKIRWVLPANSYIVYRMTGELMVDYSSAGNFGGIYDYNKHCWSEEMCELLGIPSFLMPQRFCKPYDLVGNISEEYCEMLGLKHEVQLCAGTIDCISSMLSANAVHPGDNAVVLGTSLNWGVIHKGLSRNANMISMPYAIEAEKISYSYGGSSTAGALPRWFVSTFLGSESSKEYAEIEELILKEKIPSGSNGLVVLPYFMGERTPIWDQNATGVFFGMTLAHKKSHLYFALLESVAYSLRHIMESMEFSDEKIQRLVLVGGGSRSLIWKQVFANVTGLPVYTPVNPVEAPLGDAFMAAYANGSVEHFDDIEDWIEFNEPTLPDLKMHENYERYYEIYKRLYLQLKELMALRSQIMKDNNPRPGLV